MDYLKPIEIHFFMVKCQTIKILADCCIFVIVSIAIGLHFFRNPFSNPLLS
jgi:hypothetical protein